MRLLAVLAVLVQAGAAVALLLAGAYVLAGLLVVGVLATARIAIQTSRGAHQTSHSAPGFIESEQRFW